MSAHHETHRPLERLPHLAPIAAWARASLRGYHLVLVAAIAGAVVVTLNLILVTTTRGNDDAGILWNYARNVVDGHGLVYRPGEYVEGYSSLAYVLLLALGLWAVRNVGALLSVHVDPSAIYWISLGLNFAAWMAVIAIIFKFVKEELNETAAAVIALLLGVCPAIAFWVASGMDTPYAMLSQVLIWVGVVRLERRAGTKDERGAMVWLAAAMIFSLVTRAEGFLWPVLALAWLLWRRPRQAVVLGAVFGAFALCFISWRLWYYGYPLPNTYYAKLTGSLTERLHSAWYLQARQVIFDAGFLITVAAVIAGIVGRLDSMIRFTQTRALIATDFEILAALAWIAYFQYVGGDVYFERPMLVLIPLGLVIAARVLFPSLKSAGSAALAVLVAFAVIVYPLWGYYRPRAEKFQGDGLAKLGRLLGETYPDATVALNLAGKLAYYSELPCIDMLGLCDEHVGHSEPTGPFKVGHSKRGFGYALSRKPELVVVCPQLYTGDVWSLIIDDGYTIGQMHDIGYEPVLACRWEKGLILRRAFEKELSELTEEEFKSFVNKKLIDLLVFYNPNPTGELPKSDDTDGKTSRATSAQEVDRGP
ncbi:MAG: hypothetical protein HUU46_15510 [Candidatus Hydrogenedentes bacterium]|nr:hypothetical protein [Candidatus Hydrogenedentota bacterium]